MSWDKRLDRPVVLPDGKTLRTLEDARRHILTLPKSEHETTAWQVAIEALLIAAEKRDPEPEFRNRGKPDPKIAPPSQGRHRLQDGAMTRPHMQRRLEAGHTPPRMSNIDHDRSKKNPRA